MVDAAEYGDSCTTMAAVGDAASIGSKDSANRGADASKVGCEVLAAGESGGELKFGLAELGGRIANEPLCFASDDEESGGAGKPSDGFVGAGTAASSPSS